MSVSTKEGAPKSLDAVPSGFFAFRTPLLPFGALVAWSAGLRAPAIGVEGGDDASLADALARDRALLIERLRALVVDPVVREALFVASPSLDDAIDAWLKDPASERAHGVVEILVRYFARMSTRCTPFGLFSGCSVGGTGKDTRLIVAPRAEYRRHTRLDTHYLSALCEALEKDEAIREASRFRPSSGLFPSAGQLRYAEARIDPSTRERSFHLVSVEVTDYLTRTLERARRGATREELAQALVADDPEVAIDEARGFVDQLADSQILVSDLSPPVTGREPIEDIVATLRAMPPAAKAAETLHAIDRELDSMDRGGLGLPSSRYTAIAEHLAALPAKTELPRLFQVDLFKPAPGAQLGGAPLREIERSLTLVARLRRPEGKNEGLRRFREAFVERYEGREVPLMEVLDEERGIGFDTAMAGSSEPSPLLADLPFPGGPPARGSWSGHEEWLLSRLGPLLASGARVWALDDADRKALEERTLATPPDAFAVMGTLAASSPEALAKGDFTLYLHGVSGPSGAPLLGRFTHGDPELRRRVEEHLRAEEALRPDAIFAEVVHLPEGRLGNILCRPLLRAHEIPFLGRSGAPEEAQIPLTDLRVSVRGDRVVLRSERLGKEIVPRLTSAHNHPMAALGAYRFLCALQRQDVDPIATWWWGALDRAPFLPRVTHGRVILSLAKWTLFRDDLKALDAAEPIDRWRATQAMRARLRLPRWVSLVDGDNVLPVDLDNVLHVETFAALVKRRGVATLQELFPAEDELCASGPEGLFVHELVVPFVRARAPSPPTRFEQTPRLARAFPPGSEWLYAKLYTGTATADRVLGEVIAPLVEASIREGDADGWFFIRYGDPKWHVRVRLHGDPERLAARVLPRLHRLAQPLLADGRVAKLQLDTYEREIERYGGDLGMPLCEEIFRADSDAVLAILASIRGDAASDARWRLALRGMHLLLVDLGLDLGARLALMRGVRASFAEEHRVDGDFEKQLGAKFRRDRAEIERLLAPHAPASRDAAHGHPGEAGADDEEPSPLVAGFDALAERSRRIAAVAPSLRALERDGALVGSVPAIAASLLHMHANRLLRSEQRAQELVLYDFLSRLYDSEQARARGRGRAAEGGQPPRDPAAGSAGDQGSTKG